MWCHNHSLSRVYHSRATGVVLLSRVEVQSCGELWGQKLSTWEKGRQEGRKEGRMRALSATGSRIPKHPKTVRIFSGDEGDGGIKTSIHISMHSHFKGVYFCYADYWRSTFWAHWFIFRLWNFSTSTYCKSCVMFFSNHHDRYCHSAADAWWDASLPGDIAHDETRTNSICNPVDYV